MILGWPFIPILCYFQRKEEISKANNPDQERKSPASDGSKFNNPNEL
jgi:hypothetical protein